MMKEINCRAARREIDQVELNQQLSPPTSAHVASCSACRELQRERASLRDLLRGLEPVTAPADFDFRLRARIAAEKSAPRSLFGDFVLSTPVLAGLVVFAVLLLSAMWFVQRSGNRSPALASNPPGQTKQSDAPTKEAAPRSNETPATAINSEGQEEIVYQRNNAGHAQIKSLRLAPRDGTAKDFSASPARSIRQGDPNVGEVSLSAPLRPMILSLQGDNGAMRTFSLPPVSFGSQRLLESRAIPVSQKTNQKTSTW